MKFRLGNELITLSKFPIKKGRFFRFNHAALEEKIFTNKGFFIMTIELPGSGDFQLINFHMTAGGLRHHPENPLIKWHGEYHLPPQRVDHVLINKTAGQIIKPSGAEIVLDHACIQLSNGSKISVSDHYGVQITFETVNGE